MMITTFLTDPFSRIKGEPPPPPPSRYEMIDTLEKHNCGIIGPIEDFDTMSAAKLWERYKKRQEFLNSVIDF